MRACIRSANRSQSSWSHVAADGAVAGVGPGLLRHVGVGPERLGAGRRAGRVGGGHLAGEQERRGRAPRPAATWPRASGIWPTESATCTVPGAYAGSVSHGTGPLERPVDLHGRRVQLEVPHAAGHPGGHVAGRRAAGRTGSGAATSATTARRAPHPLGRRSARRWPGRASTSMPITSASHRSSPPAAGEPRGPAPRRAARRRPRGPGSRRSGRAWSSAAPSARSPGRRAGCRRARRCRRAGCAAPSPPNRLRPRSAAGREQRRGRSRARRPGAAGPAAPSAGRTGGNGVSSAPISWSPTASHSAHSSSQASPSPACWASASRAVTSRSRCSSAQLPSANGCPSTAGACRQRRPCSSRPSDRIVARRRGQRVEGAEGVVHEVRVHVVGRCARRRRSSAGPRAPAPTSPRRRAGWRRPARWGRSRPRPRRTSSLRAARALGQERQPAQRLGVAPREQRVLQRLGHQRARARRWRPPRSTTSVSVPARLQPQGHVGLARPARRGPAARAATRVGTRRTSVWSSSTSGQVPTEWCSRDPTAGQASSTSRIRDAPTTHSG